MSDVDPTDPILLEIRQSSAIIKFNRPALRNCLSDETLTKLECLVVDLVKSSDITRLIFTGCGDIFLSGADIRELNQLDQDAALQFARRGQLLFSKIAEAEQLTVAAINGHCMGGGLDFALACDIRIASPTATFAHPGARLGIITGWGGTQRLPQIVGRARAIEFFATARRVDSIEALKIGLVHLIDDTPVEYAVRIGS